MVTPIPVPPVIFDDVWHTTTTIPDAEHQVSQLQNGKINYSDQTTGPTGDFHPGWKYVEATAPANQPFQKAGNVWNHEGPAGVNYTDAALPVNYNYSVPTNGTYV